MAITACDLNMQPQDSANGRTVLVVEDCPKLRTLCVKLLRLRGFRVLEAMSAEEALRLWDTHGAEIDLVLSDVIMPGRSGKALSDDLRRERPTLPVIFMSAFSAEALAIRGFVADSVVRKPFHPVRLLKVVEQLLIEEREADCDGAWAQPGRDGLVRDARS